MLQNARKFQRIPKISNGDLTASNANVLQKKNGHIESNNRSQMHAEEEGKRETVSD